MLESLTIFTAGGLIAYQYMANPSLASKENNDPLTHTRQLINTHLIHNILLNQREDKEFHIVQGWTLSWKKRSGYYIVIVYPDILFAGPRQYLKQWGVTLLQTTGDAYDQWKLEENKDSSSSSSFDTIFTGILQKSKTQKQTTQPEQQQKMQAKQPAGANTKQRTWGPAEKVTQKDMDALDQTNESNSRETQLEEARQGFSDSRFRSRW